MIAVLTNHHPPVATELEASSAETSLEREARKHVQKLKEFYTHLGAFISVIVGLALINILTTPGFPWFLFPALGWGIGLGAHAVEVFGLFGLGGRKWERRKMREYMMQRGGGLDAEDVRGILAEELGGRTLTQGGTGELDRLVRRIEHLEAIVTSRDWEVLEQTGRIRLDEPDEEEKPGGTSHHEAQQRAARLARRVR